MNTLCALIASGMLYCGGGDFRPVNDIVLPTGFHKIQYSQTWSNQYGSGYTHNSPQGHTYSPGCWSAYCR